jgi:hypothetical protein
MSALGKSVFFCLREGYSEEGTSKNWFCLPGGLFRGETFRPLRRKGTRGGFVASPRVATRAATRVAPSTMTGLGRERLARGTYNEYGAWRAMCVSLRVRVWVCLCLRVFVRVLTFFNGDFGRPYHLSIVLPKSRALSFCLPRRVRGIRAGATPSKIADQICSRRWAGPRPAHSARSSR